MSCLLDQENNPEITTLPARPAPRIVGNKRKRPSNARSPDETALWEDSEFCNLKKDLMRAQIQEVTSKIEKNKAVIKEANLKSDFWEKASQALGNNSLVLELRSLTQVKRIIVCLKGPGTFINAIVL